jgi:zinc transport system substrate-binding protein
MVTIEPQRYFVESLVDTFFTVETFVPSGVNPETYDPSPSRMLDLSRSDIFFYVGGLGFEAAWIDKLRSNNPDVRFHRTDLGIDPVGFGIEDGRCDDHHFSGDPHVWVSPRNALRIVENIYEVLMEVDFGHREIYFANLRELSRRIEETDARIGEILGASGCKSFLIFHPSLTYFARDYGLTQYSIESDGKEPSPERLRSLIETARREGIRTIFIQKEFDSRSVSVIAKETGCRLVEINPLSYNWHEEMLRIALSL